MCGRSYASEEMLQEMEHVVREIDAKLKRERQGREIYPTNQAPVIYQKENRLIAGEMTWGFPRYTGSGVLINSRAETLLERPTFRKSAVERRCIVPAVHFLNGILLKTKFLFTTRIPRLYIWPEFIIYFRAKSAFLLLLRKLILLSWKCITVCRWSWNRMSWRTGSSMII